MHIALNALAVQRRLFGGGTYAKNLVRSLARLNGKNQYSLYVSRENDLHFKDLGPRFKLLHAPARRPLRILWEQTALPLDLARRKVQVIHGLGFVSPLARVCSQVTTLHDMTFFLFPDKHTFSKRHYFRTMIPLCARTSDAVIAVSESTKGDIIRILGLEPEKVKVIYLGKDERFTVIRNPSLLLQAKRKYGLSKKIILFVGMIEPRKNLETLVEAYARLKGFHHDYCLVLAGPFGWGYRAVWQKVQALGLGEGEVIFLGYIPEEDLPALYNSAAVFVYPSLYEGFGLPILEAMACGVPTITSKVSSMPEVVGDAGVLVDPRSAEELANAIQRVLTDDELKEQMKDRGLSRSRLFTWDNTARATLHLYEQLAG